MTSGRTLNITLRPQTLDEVIGLRREVAAIRNLIATDRIPRAFLIAGPFGCGKTTIAYLIAREIQGDQVSEFAVREVNAASVTGVDDMRELIKTSYLTPLEGRFNVIILDEAHKLSRPAQEALLKELESPSTSAVWILCTTDRERVVEGIRAGRCFPIAVRGLEGTDRAALIARAAAAVGLPVAPEGFLRAVDRAGVTSPRRILMAFQAFHSGIALEDAIGAMHLEALPEYWEIALGVVFGTWCRPYRLSWIAGREFPGVGDQLRRLEDHLKRRASVDVETTPVEEDDVQGRPEVAQALRALTAATLKNQVTKRGSIGAAEGLQILANCYGSLAPHGLEFALVVGALFRVNARMTRSGS